ncbi:MAG: hypothetical protein M3Q50_04520, partial [Chloroflexota bacterium]|nr:hypothetical protein [Chloroflexota bacterium]
GDRFCADCGAALPALPPGSEPGLERERPPGAVPVLLDTDVSAPDPARAEAAPSEDRENAAWLLGARPAAVIGGGLLLLLLAVALLAIGQRDATGTLVMLSICTAPLGLLTLAIGIARSIASASRRG